MTSSRSISSAAINELVAESSPAGAAAETFLVGLIQMRDRAETPAEVNEVNEQILARTDAITSYLMSMSKELHSELSEFAGWARTNGSHLNRVALMELGMFAMDAHGQRTDENMFGVPLAEALADQQLVEALAAVVGIDLAPGLEL